MIPSFKVSRLHCSGLDGLLVILQLDIYQTNGGVKKQINYQFFLYFSLLGY